MSILGYELTTLIWYFIIYSFLGWCVEVIYCTVNSGTVENRGFLDGPVCPIYGFGMLLVIMLIRSCNFEQVTDCPTPVLFFGGMILASSIELLAGWVMMKLFHMRWWDYTGRPFNIGGYICLQFSICWGLGSVLTVKLVHIPLTGIIEGNFFSGVYCLPMLVVCMIIYAIDFLMTVKRVVGINRSIARFEEVSLRLHDVSEGLSQKLGNKALEMDQKIGEERVQGALAKAELLDRSKELRELSYRLDSMKEMTGSNLQKMKDFEAESTQKVKDFGKDNIQKMKDFGEGSVQKMKDFGEGSVQKVKDFGEGNVRKLIDFEKENEAVLKSLEAEQLRRKKELEAELEAILKSFQGNRFFGIRKIMHIQRLESNERVQKIWNWHIKKKEDDNE